jgi:hypothetical protein
VPRLDEFVAASLGERVEDLSGVASAQPYRPRGPQLSAAGVELLARKVTGGGRWDRRTAEVTEQLDRLTAAGLLDDRRRLTESGMTVARVLVRPRAYFRIEVVRGTPPLCVQAYLSGDHAVITANESPVAGRGREYTAAEAEAAATTMWLDFCDVSYVPVALASWVGLGPAWSLAVEPDVVPAEVLVARLGDRSVPPPGGADEALRRMWSQPWFLWTLSGSGLDRPLAFIDAGVAGPHEFYGTGDGVHSKLQPLPPAVVWERLVGRVVPAIRASRG